MELVDNFYNKVAAELMKKYFPTIKWHHNNYASQQAMYYLELFNNGCLSYNKLVENLSKYCMTDKVHIKNTINEYLN